ncbi:hypothetical protein [Mucilaginibacter sp.]|uniref:hypothetical protein n=1 Tax=Mucilaginibacter sp. TaxID=1882438 RepID=UPI002607EB87|nr:hypothetical protein [Mucilaginibacter sp.]MDB5029684.1 hypothetical protein [Mucilaginibacter sp.]
MEQQFEATLTGTDGPVSGIIKHITHGGHKKAYQFKSLDDTLYLTIAPDARGGWQKIDGTDPYLFGWVDEMAEQITNTYLFG